MSEKKKIFHGQREKSFTCGGQIGGGGHGGGCGGHICGGGGGGHGGGKAAPQQPPKVAVTGASIEAKINR